MKKKVRRRVQRRNDRERGRNIYSCFNERKEKEEVAISDDDTFHERGSSSA